MANIFFKTTYKRGYTLLEMVIYISLFILLSLAIISGLTSMTRSFRAVEANLRIQNTGMTAMEKMIREISQAEAIDLPNSTFGTSPGVLQFTYTSSGTQTIKFMTASNVLKFYRNGALVGDLTGQYISVTNLTFDNVVAADGNLIKISMTLRDTRSQNGKSETFNTSVKLRGTY